MVGVGREGALRRTGRSGRCRRSSSTRARPSCPWPAPPCLRRWRRHPRSCRAVCGGGFHRPQARSARYAWRDRPRSVSAPVTWSSDQTPPRSASAASSATRRLARRRRARQVGQGAVGQAVKFGGAGGRRRRGQRVVQPVALAQHQRFQIGAAPGGARDQHRPMSAPWPRKAAQPRAPIRGHRGSACG